MKPTYHHAPSTVIDTVEKAKARIAQVLNAHQLHSDITANNPHHLPSMLAGIKLHLSQLKVASQIEGRDEQPCQLAMDFLTTLSHAPPDSRKHINAQLIKLADWLTQYQKQVEDGTPASVEQSIATLGFSPPADESGSLRQLNALLVDQLSMNDPSGVRLAVRDTLAALTARMIKDPITTISRALSEKAGHVYALCVAISERLDTLCSLELHETLHSQLSLLTVYLNDFFYGDAAMAGIAYSHLRDLELATHQAVLTERRRAKQADDENLITLTELVGLALEAFTEDMPDHEKMSRSAEIVQACDETANTLRAFDYAGIATILRFLARNLQLGLSEDLVEPTYTLALHATSYALNNGNREMIDVLVENLCAEHWPHPLSQNDARSIRYQLQQAAQSLEPPLPFLPTDPNPINQTPLSERIVRLRQVESSNLISVSNSDPSTAPSLVHDAQAIGTEVLNRLSQAQFGLGTITSDIRQLTQTQQSIQLGIDQLAAPKPAKKAGPCPSSPTWLLSRLGEQTDHVRTQADAATHKINEIEALTTELIEKVAEHQRLLESALSIPATAIEAALQDFVTQCYAAARVATISRITFSAANPMHYSPATGALIATTLQTLIAITLEHDLLAPAISYSIELKDGGELIDVVATQIDGKTQPLSTTVLPMYALYPPVCGETAALLDQLHTLTPQSHMTLNRRDGVLTAHLVVRQGQSLSSLVMIHCDNALYAITEDAIRRTLSADAGTLVPMGEQYAYRVGNHLYPIHWLNELLHLEGDSATPPIPKNVNGVILETTDSSGNVHLVIADDIGDRLKLAIEPLGSFFPNLPTLLGVIPLPTLDRVPLINLSVLVDYAASHKDHLHTSHTLLPVDTAVQRK